jgi:hypothetical protein
MSTKYMAKTVEKNSFFEKFEAITYEYQDMEKLCTS